MSCKSSATGNFDPLSSWEAPWNHMKYFWHNDPEPSVEQETDCNCSTSLPRPQHFCQVHETSCTETRGIRPRREIIAVKPIPWRNVYPPTPPPLSGNIPCSCGAPKAKIRKQKDNLTLDQNVRQDNVLKFKKTPKAFSHCSECVRQWKEDAANQELADMIQSIRDAPTTKIPGRVCDGEFNIPTDYCSFCNQPLSAFGFCNECLPPTPKVTPVVIPEQKKEQKIEKKCVRECVMPTLPSSHFMDPCKLLREINSLQPTFAPPGNAIPGCNSKPNTTSSNPMTTLMQSQNMHDQLEKDCLQGAFLQPNIFQGKFCDSCQMSQLTKTDNFRSTIGDEFPNTKPSYTFHLPNVCHHCNSGQPNSINYPGQAISQSNTNNYPVQTTAPPQPSPRNPLSQWPLPGAFQRIESPRPQPNNPGRPSGTLAHFGVTLDVGNTSAHDITVVLYTNRILVAETVNYTVNGEIVSAQSWALPNGVDADTLRCYLGDGKLYIVSFPPPTGFNWRFATYPAALGPPKFSNQPCPFEP